MDIQQLVDRVRTTPDCVVWPSAGTPGLESGQVLPDDIRTFYSLCGGMVLYQSRGYPVKIPGPDGFIQADPVLLASMLQHLIDDGTYEQTWISRDWYTVADLGNGNYVVIDCSRDAKRLGRCYSALWEDYPSVGATPIVARSFAELLERLVAGRGERWYFLQDDFVPYGDAYDAI